MSFGFEVYSADGQLEIDDKDFTVVGERVYVAAGEHYFPRENGLVTIAAMGDDLTYLSVIFTPTQLRVFTGGGYLMFYRDSKYVASQDVFGIDVVDALGRTTFSSSNLHFTVASITPLGVQDMGYTVPRQSNKAYMLSAMGRLTSLRQEGQNFLFNVYYPSIERVGAGVRVSQVLLGKTGWPEDWTVYSPNSLGNLIVLNGV